MNLYAFCGNNPVNFVDPFGHCEKGLGEQIVIISGLTIAVVALAPVEIPGAAGIILAGFGGVFVGGGVVVAEEMGLGVGPSGIEEANLSNPGSAELYINAANGNLNMPFGF